MRGGRVTPESSREEQIAAIVALARTGYLPVVEEGEGQPAATRFGGRPWLANGESWPNCGACGEPMMFLVQVNRAELTDRQAEYLRGDGLMQLFYCQDWDCSADIWKPFSAGSLARLVPSASLEDGGFAVAPTTLRLVDPNLVVGWTERTESPGPEERPRYGIDLELSWDDEDRLGPVEDDKLGGWPCWMQHVEYPDCPRCGTEMNLVLQIPSESLADVLLGDAGVGHVTQCHTHPDVLAFGWACA